LKTAWDNFIAELKLHAEVTNFSINEKQHIYIRLGSWKEKTHPPLTPLAVWKKACCEGSYSVPKLQISSLSMQLASGILNLGFNLVQHLEKDR